jgi:hypothetical protein
MVGLTAQITILNRRYHRFLSSEEKDELFSEGMPIILVPSNSARHALNKAAVRHFASLGHAVLRIDSHFEKSQGKLSDESRTFISHLGDEHTNRMPLTLYLYKGMKVMVGDNIAVQMGICNGTTATVVGWHYHNTIQFDRIDDDTIGTKVTVATDLPEFILIRVDTPRFEPFVSLGGVVDDPEAIFPIFPENIKCSVPLHRARRGEKAKTAVIKIRGFTLGAATAITIHKSQSISVSKLAIGTWMSWEGHLASLAQIYVALSRVRSSDGLILFQQLPLVAKKLKPPLDLATEMTRLRALSKATKEGFLDRYIT